MHTPHVSSGGRYPVLRTLAILYLFAAACVLVVGIWQAISVLVAETPFTNDVFGANTGMSGRILVAVSWLAATFIGVLMMLGIAELVKLFIDIEHNTRLAGMRSMAGAVGAADAAAVIVPTETGAAVAVVTPAGDGSGTPVAAPGAPAATGGRIGQWLEGEETAEGALLRGH